MPEKKPNITLRVAQNLLDHLAEPINSQLKDLLEGIEKKPNISRDINKLLYEHENIRLWMEEQTSSESGTKGDLLGGGYQSLPGHSNLISASQKWVCPKNKRDHWILVIQEGESAPICKIHKTEMEREIKEKG